MKAQQNTQSEFVPTVKFALRKRGDVREDGMIFQRYHTRSNGTVYEQWRSKESIERQRKKQAAYSKRCYQKMKLAKLESKLNDLKQRRDTPPATPAPGLWTRIKYALRYVVKPNGAAI